MKPRLRVLEGLLYIELRVLEGLLYIELRVLEGLLYTETMAEGSGGAALP